MRPKHIEELLDTLCQMEVKPGKRKLSVYVEGPPGSGKTHVCLQAAERNNRFLVGPTETGVIHPIMLEPIDLSGVPSVVDGRTRWNPPEWAIGKVPKGFDGVMVLIDEFPQADPQMQKACAPIFEEHRIGNAILPEGTIVVATGNRVGDRSGASKVLSHIRRRYAKVEFDSNLEDFEDWGVNTGNIIPEVRYFMRFKPQAMNNFDPQSEQQYASQSGWEKVSDIYPHLPAHLCHQTVTGLIGAAGNEFLAFAKVWQELYRTYDVSRILAEPTKAPVPPKNQPDILWSLVGSIAEHVKEKNVAAVNQAIKYFQRLPREFLYIGVQHTVIRANIERRKEIYATEEYKKFVVANLDLMKEASAIQ